LRKEDEPMPQAPENDIHVAFNALESYEATCRACVQTQSTLLGFLTSRSDYSIRRRTHLVEIREYPKVEIDSFESTLLTAEAV
jgi:hypothetical protein